MAQERILIVDGNIALLEILRWKLEASGYQVDCAPSGKEALDIINDRWIDLIVLAIVLQGGMDGVQLFKEIKELGFEITLVSSDSIERMDSETVYQIVKKEKINSVVIDVKNNHDPSKMIRLLKRESGTATVKPTIFSTNADAPMPPATAVWLYLT